MIVRLRHDWQNDNVSTRHLSGRELLRSCALVFVGGTVGTGIRELLGLLPTGDLGFPVITMGINILGAFVLGLVLESVRLSDSARASALRLLVGTGLLGGFTTYSALALDTVRLGSGASPAFAVLYAGGTLVVGTLAALAGVASGARLRSGRTK